MKRLLLGIIAGGCLLVAAGLWLVGAATDALVALIGNLVRIGAVLAVVWLAWPQFGKVFNNTPRWLMAAIVGGIALVAIKPMLILYVAGALGVLWFLAPRTPLGSLISASKDAAPRRRVPWARKGEDPPKLEAKDKP